MKGKKSVRALICTPPARPDGRITEPVYPVAKFVRPQAPTTANVAVADARAAAAAAAAVHPILIAPIMRGAATRVA